MSALSCQAAGLLVWLVYVYSIVLFVYAVLSWIPSLQYRFARYLAPFVEPVLAPLRRFIPPMGGLDMSFLILIVLLQIVVRPLLFRLEIQVCSL